MTRIADLLDRDLFRPVEEFVRIDNDDPETVFAELTEYVATERVESEYVRLLSAMADARVGAEGVGVWISGSFGSGRSSFAKTLGYILSNREICGVTARSLFLRQVHSERISAILDSLNRAGGYEVFPVTVATGLRAGEPQLVEMMYQALLRGVGYAEDHELAGLERQPEEEGRLPAFARTAWTPSVQELVAKSFEFCEARRPGKAFAFILDDVGDAIDTSSGCLEKLCDIADRFGRECAERRKRGGAPARVWIVVTAQRSLGEVQRRARTNRIDADLEHRFPYQVDLSDADITEVATRRVLRKKEDQKPVLRKLFQDFGASLIQNTRLEGCPRQNEFNEDQFVESYPYLPHLLDLSLCTLEGIRRQPDAPKYVESSNRTLVRQCFEMLVSGHTRLADEPLGALVSIDRIYELVDGNTPWEKQKAILDIRQRFDDDIDHPGMAARIAKAVCLMEFVQPGLPRTTRNIAALLVRRINEAPPALAVAELLERLQAAQFVAETQDGWTLYDFNELRRAANSAAWLNDAVGAVNPRPPGWRNDIIQLGKRMVATPLRWYIRPLKEFNAAVSLALKEVVNALDHISMNMLAADHLSMKIGRCDGEASAPREVNDHFSAIYAAIEQLSMDGAALEKRLAQSEHGSHAEMSGTNDRTTYLIGLFGTGRRYINELIQQNIGERARYFRDAIRLHPGPTPMIYSGHVTIKHVSRAQETPDVMARILNAVGAGFADSIFIYRHPLDSLLTNWVWWRSYIRNNQSVSGIAQAYKNADAFRADLERNFSDFRAFAEGRPEFYVGLDGPRFLSFAEFVEETELHLQSAKLALRLEDFLADPLGQFSRIADLMSVRLAPGIQSLALPRTRAYGYREVREKVPAFASFIGELDAGVVRRIEAIGYVI